MCSSRQPKEDGEDYDPRESMETDGPGGRGDAMRREIHCLDDASDRAGLDALASLAGGAHLVALAVPDSVAAFARRLHPPPRGQLL